MREKRTEGALIAGKASVMLDDVYPRATQNQREHFAEKNEQSFKSMGGGGVGGGGWVSEISTHQTAIKQLDCGDLKIDVEVPRTL